jgi:hypothetical protein
MSSRQSHYTEGPVMNSSRRRLGVRSLLARIASRGRAARRFSGALAVALAAIGLMPTAAGAADSSLEQVIDMVVQPRASAAISGPSMSS